MRPMSVRARVKAEMQEVVAFQEKAGIDVLVHGRPHRNDMVQYLAEQLTGYLTTQHDPVPSIRPVRSSARARTARRGEARAHGTGYLRPPLWPATSPAPNQ